MYEFGYGVRVSIYRAYENYESAAAFGNVTAMSKVALHYENLDEIDRAVDWYTLAADFENEFAINKLKDLSKVVNCERDLQTLKKDILKKHRGTDRLSQV